MNKSSSIYTIPLPRDPSLADYPVNRVFLISGEKNILIDSGHASQWQFLEHSLRGLEIDTNDISEIYYTGQSSDAIGNRPRFSNARHFSTSKDSANEKVDRLLALIEPYLEPAILDAIATFAKVQEGDDTELSQIADGDTVQLNEVTFDVVSTGSRTLFLSEQFSFVGEISMGEIPPLMPDSDDLQRVVSRAQNLAEGVVYSTFRDPYENSAWFFKQTQRAFQAFQQSAKLDLTLEEFCKRDLGGVPDDPMFWALNLLKYAPFFLPMESLKH